MTLLIGVIIGICIGVFIPGPFDETIKRLIRSGWSKLMGIFKKGG
jgi:ABC-type dipeptide/oligopeptide/nickel transport system permease subunit